ncbi:MAG: DMT family transporter [Bacteroidetes bacterium]|nr:DMT family transporter [Fibrella sp.]
MTKPALADYLHLHFIVLIWGFTAILGLLLEPLSAPALVAWRTVLAAGGMGLVLAARGGAVWAQVRHLPASARWPLLATGGIIALHWATFFGAARLANASVCLAGMATGSLWTSVLDPLMSRRKVRAIEVVLGAVVLAGLYLIFRFEFSRGAGLAMAVFSAMLASVFTILNSRFTHQYDALVISFYEMVGAFVGSLGFLAGYLALVRAPGGWAAFVPVGWQWLWISLLAFVCTVYAYTAAVRLLRKFSAFAANLTVNLEPVYGIGLAYLVFGDSERMTPGFYVGTLVILVAVLVYPLLNRRQPTVTPIEPVP